MDVKVNIYNLPNAQRTNAYLVSLGIGLYHTGVEVNGAEYSFSSQGISRTPPRLPDFGTFKEQMNLGRFSGSMNDLQVKLERMRTTTFREGMYDIVHLNCNHFSDALCFELIHMHIPEWVNRAAALAGSVAPKGAQPTADTSGFAPLGQVSNKSPIYSSGVSKPVGSNTSNSGTATNTPSNDAPPATFSSHFTWLGDIFGGFSAASASTNTPTGSGGSGGDTTSLTTGTTASKAEKVILAKENTSKKREMSQQQREMLEKLKSKGK